MILFLFDIFREAYPSFHITHLTLAYNIAQLQHVYKRRFVVLLLFDDILVWFLVNLIFVFGNKVKQCLHKVVNDLLFIIINVDKCVV
jgi:hypothetical protein